MRLRLRGSGSRCGPRGKCSRRSTSGRTSSRARCWGQPSAMRWATPWSSSSPWRARFARNTARRASRSSSCIGAARASTSRRTPTTPRWPRRCFAGWSSGRPSTPRCGTSPSASCAGRGAAGRAPSAGEMRVSLAAARWRPERTHRRPGERRPAAAARRRSDPFGLGVQQPRLRVREEEQGGGALEAHGHRNPIALAACAAMASGHEAARAWRGGYPDRDIRDGGRRMPLRAAGTAGDDGEGDRRKARAGVGPEVTLDRLRAWAAHEAIAAAVYVVSSATATTLQAAILRRHEHAGRQRQHRDAGRSASSERAAGARALPADWVRDVERADELLAALALEI